MRTKNFIQTAALMLGMTISSVMITSCTAEDNPVNEPTYDPEVVLEFKQLVRYGHRNTFYIA